MGQTRIERDPLGELPVPTEALWGIQTERARQNFPISNLRPLPAFVDAVILIKKAAALTHRETGRLDRKLADAIIAAADEVLAGGHRDQFVVDPYQAGAGTSHNMNGNEVLANRANELLGGKRGDYKPVHPNDHVNMAQSTNDVIPTAIRLGALSQLAALTESLTRLARACLAKGEAFDNIVKSGRTHLQDATPIRLGQEFTAFGHTVERNRDRITRAADDLRDLGIGGTAVGTGLNAEPQYPALMVTHLRAMTGLELREGKDRVQLMQSLGDAAAFSGALRTYAADLGKIAGDLRLLASGPRTGFAEILLPAVQPGSSIMPGKVNPSIPEHHGRGGGAARIERHDARHRPQHPDVDDDPQQRHARAGGALRRGHRSQRRAERALAGAQPGARHGARPQDRLRRSREVGEGGRGEECHRTPAGDREGTVEREGARRGPRFAGDDGAGRAGGAEEAVTLTTETRA